MVKLLPIPVILNEILVSWKAVQRQHELKGEFASCYYSRTTLQMSAAIDLGRKIQYIYLHDHLPSLGNESRIIISKRYPVKNS
jgi:hypothetical protein